MPVLLYDRLCYGKSSPLTEKHGLDYIHKEAKLPEHLIQHFSLKKYYLLGHSEGGLLALIHAAHHPHFDYPGKVLAAVCNFIARG